ncbi:hypothetical protein FBU30_008691 [Linnemannia zychae]|nr:hypothetical protein FBU30_008691 [Linnemannia zychae]
MHKFFLLFSALCVANVALAQYHILITNNDGSKSMWLDVLDGNRHCFCLSQTQTATIEGQLGGDVKLFSRSDCTGSYSSGSGKTTYNAQWVNSVSFGASGIPSTWGPRGSTCSQYPF